jgi:hypothetical protein
VFPSSVPHPPLVRTRSSWRRFVATAATVAMVVVSLVSVAASAADRPSLWLSPSDLAALPTSGPAWSQVKGAADETLAGSEANLADRTDHNLGTLAAALVGARLDSDAYRGKVRDALADVVAQEPDRGDVLAAARRLGSYAIAADLVDLSGFDPAFDRRFRTWLGQMLTFEYSGGGGGGSIVDVHERRANNFGTHAGASRVAAAAYLGDRVELDRAADVFRGWLGDRAAYAGFDYGDLSWQADASRPVGVNPAGATRDGHSVDGVLPDDQRRGGGFTWPPPQENYVWGALQGATVQAELLARQGYDAWDWQDRALLRSVTWLHEQADFPATGDDAWVPWLVNHAYGTSFPGDTGAGKNLGFAAWSHAGGSGAPSSPRTAPTARDVSDTCDGADGSSFRDADGNVHRDTIDCATHRGIASGKGDRRYAPAETLRRDQIASFLANTLRAGGASLPDPSSVEDHYPDDDGNVHEDAINVLTEAGVLPAAGANYRPSGPVSRSEMAVMVANALDLERSPSGDAPDFFSDDDGLPAEPAIDRVAHEGVVLGTGGGRYAPHTTLRRDQMATFLVRLLNAIE